MSSSETLAPQTTRLEPWSILESRLELELPAEWLDFINGLLKDSGDSPERLFRRALGLYRLALDARAEGKVVGAADSADSLTEEFEF